MPHQGINPDHQLVSLPKVLSGGNFCLPLAWRRHESCKKSRSAQHHSVHWPVSADTRSFLSLSHPLHGKESQVWRLYMVNKIRRRRKKEMHSSLSVSVSY